MDKIIPERDMTKYTQNVSIWFTLEQWEAIEELTRNSSRPRQLILTDIVLKYFRELQDRGEHCPIYPF